MARKRHAARALRLAKARLSAYSAALESHRWDAIRHDHLSTPDLRIERLRIEGVISETRAEIGALEGYSGNKIGVTVSHGEPSGMGSIGRVNVSPAQVSDAPSKDPSSDPEAVRLWLCAKARDLIERKHYEIEETRPVILASIGNGKRKPKGSASAVRKSVPNADMQALAMMYRVYADLALVPKAPTRSEVTGLNGAPLTSEITPATARAIMGELFPKITSQNGRVSAEPRGAGGEGDAPSGAPFP